MWLPYFIRAYRKDSEHFAHSSIRVHIPESLMVQSKCCFKDTATIASCCDRIATEQRKKWFLDFDASNLYLSYVRIENACSFFDLIYTVQVSAMRIDAPLLQHTFCRFFFFRKEVHQQKLTSFFQSVAVLSFGSVQFHLFCSFVLSTRLVYDITIFFIISIVCALCCKAL